MKLIKDWAWIFWNFRWHPSHVRSLIEKEIEREKSEMARARAVEYLKIIKDNGPNMLGYW